MAPWATYYVAFLPLVLTRRLMQKRVVNASRQAVDSTGVADPSHTDAVKTLLLRACVLELAEEFEITGRKLDVKNMSGENGTLREALKLQWDIEDKTWMPPGNAVKKVVRRWYAELEAARTNVKRWGFSVDRALGACENREGVLFHQCISRLTNERDTTTMTWPWRLEFGSTPIDAALATVRFKERLKVNKSDKHVHAIVEEALELVRSGNLTALLAILWKSEQELLPIETITTHAYRAHPRVAPHIDINKQRWAIAKTAINKAFGFSTRRAKGICAKKLSGNSSNFDNFGVAVEHALAEVTDSVALEDGECREVSTTYCPEGFSPKLTRDIGPMMFKAWLASNLGSQEVTVAIMGLAGLVHPSIAASTAATFGLHLPAAAAASHLGAAATMIGFAYLLPFAWISMATFTIGAGVYAAAYPTCRCHPDAWRYDAALGTCVVQSHGKTANRYHWLPYPGQKIVPSGSKCVPSSCQEDDLNVSTGDGQIFGTLGYKNGVIYNCLSTNGLLEGSLMAKHMLRMLPSETIDNDGFAYPPNTVENRQRVYDRLDKLDPLVQGTMLSTITKRQ